MKIVQISKFALCIGKNLKYIRMKKFIFSIAVLGSFSSQIIAQGNLPGGFKHIIEVGRYSDYGKGYLTITDANGVGITKNGVSKMNYYTYEYTDEYKETKGNHLYKGELILEVDGVSAAGWTKEQFYSKVDNRHDIITLKIRVKTDTGIIYDCETKIRPLYELPDSVKQFGDVFATLRGKTVAEERKDGLPKDVIYEERIDEDFDFFPCVFYDYLLTSNDPLLDKETLKKLNLDWERKEEKPDILLTIARDAKENISSTYIPPTSRVVNEGSTTKVRYNYILHKDEYITTPKNRIIHEGGYTQETKTGDIFLEIAALDVKRLNDKSITYPPVVWKATVKRHVVDHNFNLNNEFKAYASWMTLPMRDRNVWVEKTIYAPLGVSCSHNDLSLAQNVVAGSRAEKIGLMPGDKVIKADVPDNKFLSKYLKKNLKEQGWNAVNNYSSCTINIIVERNGKKMKFTLLPSSIQVYRHYWVGAK